jgi:hypothetical protein
MVVVVPTHARHMHRGAHKSGSMLRTFLQSLRASHGGEIPGFSRVALSTISKTFLKEKEEKKFVKQ